MTNPPSDRAPETRTRPADTQDGPKPGGSPRSIGMRLDDLLNRARSPSARWPLALALVYAAAITWLVAPGGLYIDDIRAQAYAANRPIWPFVIESNRTHLAPGARLVDWLMANLAPLSHTPAVVLTVLSSTGLATALWLLLRELTSRCSSVMVGTTLIVTSAGLVPSTAWFRQSLTTHVALTLSVLAVWATVRSVRRGVRALGYLPIVLLPLAYCFSERAILVTALVAWVHLVHGGRTWRDRFRSALPVCLPLALLTTGFLAAYTSGDYDTLDRGSPSIGHFLASTGRSFFKNTVPALFGGPLLWRAERGPYAFASTPVVFSVLACIVFFVVVALALRRPHGRRTILAVAIPGAIFVLGVYLLLYFGRVSRADVNSVDDLRLYPDVLVTLGVLLAVAIDSMPVPTSTAARAASVAGGAVVLAATAVSWHGFATRWHGSTSTDYIDALRASLDADVRTPVVPSPVPETVVPWWVQPDFSTEPLTALLSPRTPTAVVDGPARIIDSSGEAQPATLTWVRSSGGSDDFCAAPLVNGEASLRLSGTTAPVRGSVVRAGILVADTTEIRVGVMDREGRTTMVETVQPIRVHRGPHTIMVPAPHGVEFRSVVVRQADPAIDVCLVSSAVAIPEIRR